MRRTRQGFTMAETLFAIFIVTITALIMSAALPLGHQSRQKADLRTRAAEIAQRQMERIRAAGYPNITTDGLLAYGLIDSSTTQTDGYPFTNVDSGRGDAISSVLPTGTGFVAHSQLALNLRSVTVTVKWVERGKNRSIKMATIVGNL